MTAVSVPPWSSVRASSWSAAVTAVRSSPASSLTRAEARTHYSLPRSFRGGYWAASPSPVPWR